MCVQLWDEGLKQRINDQYRTTLVALYENLLLFQCSDCVTFLIFFLSHLFIIIGFTALHTHTHNLLPFSCVSFSTTTTYILQAGIDAPTHEQKNAVPDLCLLQLHPVLHLTPSNSIILIIPPYSCFKVCYPQSPKFNILIVETLSSCLFNLCKHPLQVIKVR